MHWEVGTQSHDNMTTHGFSNGLILNTNTNNTQKQSKNKGALTQTVTHPRLFKISRAPITFCSSVFTPIFCVIYINTVYILVYNSNSWNVAFVAELFDVYSLFSPLFTWVLLFHFTRGELLNIFLSDIYSALSLKENPGRTSGLEFSHIRLFFDN